MKNFRSPFYLFAILALSACGTPKSVIDQANHGIALTSQMELELKEFRRNEANSEQFMVDVLALQQAVAARQMKNFRENDLARQAVGDAATQRIIDNFNTYLRGLADSDATTADALKTSNRTLSALLAPLPSTGAATTDTQSKFAEFGKELPWSVRKDEFKNLADAIRTNVKENKKKIAEAEAKAKAKSAALPPGPGAAAAPTP
jgi:hypothetical protein